MIKNIKNLIFANILTLTLLTACHANEDTDASAKTQAANSAKMITGEIKETMNAGGYTYILLNAEGFSNWIAGPKTTVSVGQTISIPPPVPMKNFKSAALNREFETIYFAAKIITKDSNNTTVMPAVAKADPAIANPHAGMDMNKMAEAGEKTTTPNEHVSSEKGTQLKGIKKVKDGITINDILKQKNELAGKTVKVRGKVVKYTSEVMDKNWIHIQDSSTEGDLTITTKNKVSVGDTIIVDGKIAVNKDFGYGYIYDVILEDAKITIE